MKAKSDFPLDDAPEGGAGKRTLGTQMDDVTLAARRRLDKKLSGVVVNAAYAVYLWLKACFLVFVCMSIIACTESSADENENVLLRILPLGDSITQGDRNHNSYRAALWRMLQKEGYKVDFVGSLNKNHFGGPPDLQFDLDHEGHWGWRADEIINGTFYSGGLSDFLEHYTPDMVLMHLGTNDVFQGQSIASTAAELKTIVNILRADNPNVTILMAKLIPTTNPTINHKIESLNDEIGKIASEATLQDSKIVVVDHFSTFNPAADTYDGVHPNAMGERKMAETWFDALEALGACRI